MPNFHVRWGDLISPRAMYAFTIGDAVAALPTLLAMAGCFIGGATLVYVVKWILLRILLCKEIPKKRMLTNCEVCPTTNKKKQYWTTVPVHNAASILHLFIEVFFCFGLIVVALFAAAIGNLNLWESAIGSVGIGIIGTYIFSTGLSQAGAGLFIFMTNAFTHGEYWCLVGSGGEVEGRITRISLLFMEMERFDQATSSGVTVRVWMTTAITGHWIRHLKKELYAERVSMDVPPEATTASAVGGGGLPLDDVAIDIGSGRDGLRKRNKAHAV